jgi:hypothetical protein
MLDLGPVRPQTTSTAPQTNAQAFATGSDVHLSPPGGHQVLAHEAVHIMQQGGPSAASVAAANTAVGHYGR